MKTIEIKNRWTGAVIREAPATDDNSANLYSANLSGADLSGANLSGANLYSAYLYSANLYSAYLYSAYLYSANLYSANLSRADLRGTCLDPACRPVCRDDDLHCFDVDGEWVYGWRTRKSQHVGTTVYEPGVYTAPVFSVADTACHPGIYIATAEWLSEQYPDFAGDDFVRARAKRGDIHKAADKYRCKQIEVGPEGEMFW